MAEMEYMHVCDYAFFAHGGKPCLIGIFDRINALAFPIHYPFMAVTIQLRGNPHEVVPLKMELGRPNGDVLMKLEGQAVVEGDGSAFSAFNLVNAQFPDAGRYTVKVSTGGRTLATHSLHVQRVQNPPQTGPIGMPPRPVH